MSNREQSQRERELDAQAERKRELSAHEKSAQSASEMARQATQERIQNPEFLDKLRDPDVDTEVFSELEAEFGPALSGAHVIANRDHRHDHRREWLNYNEAERMITERKPGRLLREDPELLAVALGKDDPAEVDEVIKTPKQKRSIRHAMDVRTALQSLAANAEGLKSLTEATAVNRTETSEQEEARLRDRVSTVYGG